MSIVCSADHGSKATSTCMRYRKLQQSSWRNPTACEYRQQALLVMRVVTDIGVRTAERRCVEYIDGNGTYISARSLVQCRRYYTLSVLCVRASLRPVAVHCDNDGTRWDYRRPHSGRGNTILPFSMIMLQGDFPFLR